MIRNGSGLKNSAARLEAVARQSGPQAAYNLLLRGEVASGWRRPSVAIYDHSLHLIGGGQKYGCTMAKALQDDFDITLLANRPVSLDTLMEWYGLDLSRCSVKIVPLDRFGQTERNQIDPGLVSARTDNPFEAVSRESGNYDMFVNASMLEMVYPLSNVSLFVCHFPERSKGAYFYVHHYEHLIYNSLYGAEWISKKWHISPSHHLYPPVDMEPVDSISPPKDKIILSVARFETGGSKQQAEMIDAFQGLRTRFENDLEGWKLILCGGSSASNPYLEKLQQTLHAQSGVPVELKINVPLSELKQLYSRSAIFWHLCGLGQTNPAHVEHFGMSTVEAMQNGCVPIVFDGGGQREIVEHGSSGYRFASTRELSDRTVKVIRDQNLRDRLSRAAHERSKLFSESVFTANVRQLFKHLADEYAQGEPL